MDEADKIREELDNIEGASILRQMQGEGNMISFARGVEDDLEKIHWYKTEEGQAYLEKKRKAIYSGIRDRIDIGEDIIFITKSRVIDHYLTGGRFNKAAFYDCRGFTEEDYPFEGLSMGGIIESADINVITEGSHNVLSLYTKQHVIDDALHHYELLLGITNEKLLADFSNFFWDIFLDEESRMKDLSWKTKLWDDRVCLVSDIIGKECFESATESVTQYLDQLTDHLNEVKTSYQDIEEWEDDLEHIGFVKNYLQSKNDQMEQPNIIHPSDIFSINAREAADHLAQVIDEQIKPSKPYRLRYGSRLDESIHLDKLLKTITARGGGCYDGNISNLVSEKKDFELRHHLDGMPYGMTFSYGNQK